MMTTARIERLIASGQYAIALDAVLDNGRPLTAALYARLHEPQVIAVAAESLALLRATELVYGPSPAIDALAARLLDRFEARGGSFADDRLRVIGTDSGHRRIADRRVTATALCVRALVDALRRSTLSERIAQVAQEAVRSGLHSLAQAGVAATTSTGVGMGTGMSVGHATCSRSRSRAGIDAVDAALLGWLFDGRAEPAGGAGALVTAAVGPTLAATAPEGPAKQRSNDHARHTRAWRHAAARRSTAPASRGASRRSTPTGHQQWLFFDPHSAGADVTDHPSTRDRVTPIARVRRAATPVPAGDTPERPRPRRRPRPDRSC